MKSKTQEMTLEEFNKLIMDDAEQMLMSVIENCRKEKHKDKERVNEGSKF